MKRDIVERLDALSNPREVIVDVVNICLREMNIKKENRENKPHTSDGTRRKREIGRER